MDHRRDSESGEPGADGELVVDVEGFEGPLDLLLDLARRQKVDLREISILALAEQYIAFVENARRLRLELAADYLVTAAWLAFLKSRLLLPEPPKAEGPSAGELTEALALRLRRLEAVRAAARQLSTRPQLGREVFARPVPAAPEDAARPFSATLHDLLAAYGRGRQPAPVARVSVAKRRVLSLADARDALERLLGPAGEWVPLEIVLRFLPDPALRRTALASGLAAALELAREGRASLRQDRAFAPLLLRKREPLLRAVPG